MKKMILVLLLMGSILCGCAPREYETVSDEFRIPDISAAAQLRVDLPQDAAVDAISSAEEDRLYLCDGYTLTLETFAAGDLDKTFLAITGFHREALSVVSQMQQGSKRYDFVWTCAGEGGDQLCRGAILDDGNYHYAVTAMAREEQAGQVKESWERIFSSISLED